MRERGSSISVDGESPAGRTRESGGADSRVRRGGLSPKYPRRSALASRSQALGDLGRPLEELVQKLGLHYPQHDAADSHQPTGAGRNGVGGNVRGVCGGHAARLRRDKFRLGRRASWCRTSAQRSALGGPHVGRVRPRPTRPTPAARRLHGARGRSGAAPEVQAELLGWRAPALLGAAQHPVPARAPSLGDRAEGPRGDLDPLERNEPRRCTSAGPAVATSPAVVGQRSTRVPAGAGDRAAHHRPPPIAARRASTRFLACSLPDTSTAPAASACLRFAGVRS